MDEILSQEFTATTFSKADVNPDWSIFNPYQRGDIVSDCNGESYFGGFGVMGLAGTMERTYTAKPHQKLKISLKVLLRGWK